MNKRFLLTIMMVALLLPVAYGGFTPTSLPKSDIAEYNGYKVYSGNGAVAKMEFAVYDTDIQTLSNLEGLAGYNGEKYIYAYHVFSLAGDPIESIKVLGFNPNAVTSVDNLNAAQVLGGNDSEGVETNEWDLGDAEATWFVTDDTEQLSIGKSSWFLLIFSDASPVTGDFEVNPQSDALVPGGDSENPIPEPATMTLLLGGMLLTLKRRK